MGVSVFAEGMGLFHKGSGGKGVAPGDVCLSPPPPPTGPAPVPYVNTLSAGDLTKGSKKVKIQGQPTALENKSVVSTSTGNEAGTQGGGVVTHKTKGKAVFKTWCSVVKIEGKGIGCHGHMMMQNTSSEMPNCIDAQAVTDMCDMLTKKQKETECEEPYTQDKRVPLNQAQYDEVYGQPCWECQRDYKAGLQRTKGFKSGLKDSRQMTPDHQPPLNIAWELGGCNMTKKEWEDYMGSPERVKPHCNRHACSQGGKVGKLAKEKIWGFIS